MIKRLRSPLKRDARSPTRASWEIDWQGKDNMLKIAMFEENARTAKGEVLSEVREKIRNMEKQKSLPRILKKKTKMKIRKLELTEENLTDGVFRRLARCVFLLIRCFNARKKSDLSVAHENLVAYNYYSNSSERCSINLVLRNILTSPPEVRKFEELQVAAAYLRASGASRAIMGPTTTADDENLAKVVAFEKYENGRILAKQGQNIQKFYFVLRGKVLLVKEYHVGNSIISKTTAVLSKGQKTCAEEFQHEVTRGNSMICKGTVEVLSVYRDDYFTLRRDKKCGAQEYLSQHSLLKNFPTNQFPIHQRNLLQLNHYPKGTIVFGGGSESEWVYVIKAGECVLMRSQYIKDVSNKKKSLFNKQTIHQLGCDRSLQKRSRLMADFCMWRREPPVSSFRSKTTQHMGQSLRHFAFPKDEEKVVENEAMSISFPPISIQKTERAPHCSGIDPLDASMTGVTTKRKPVLSRPRFLASIPRNEKDENEPPESKITANSAPPPPSLREAFVELGRLKPGDVFGLDDLYASSENVNRISLLSNGADVVKIKRRFFLKCAPINLLMQLSNLNHNYPSVIEAQARVEATETWMLYKQSLIRVLKKEPFDSARFDCRKYELRRKKATTTKTLKKSLLNKSNTLFKFEQKKLRMATSTLFPRNEL